LSGFQLIVVIIISIILVTSIILTLIIIINTLQYQIRLRRRNINLGEERKPFDHILKSLHSIFLEFRCLFKSYILMYISHNKLAVFAATYVQTAMAYDIDEQP